MSVVLNKAGSSHARELIKSGRVDSSGDWSFSAEDGNALLGKDGADWKNYGSYFLGEDTSQPEQTKERYKYPFGKDGKLYRSALTAIRQRSAQQNEKDLFDAAGELLSSIEGDKQYQAKAPFTASMELPQALGPAAKVPTEFLLLPLGSWNGYVDPESGKVTPFTITNKEVDEAISAFKAMKAKHPERDLVIDNDHLTLMDTFAPAYGWIKDLVKAADGLHSIVEWTKLGLDAIRDKTYRYISPVFAWNVTDKESGKTLPFVIINAALTNEPFFDQLIIAKYVNQSTRKEGISMKNLIAKLIATFALAEAATEEEIVAKFDEQQTMITGLIAAKTELLAALGLKPEATTEEAKGIIVAAKNGATSLQGVMTELTQLKKNLLDEKFNQVIAKGVADGRILPAQKADQEWLGTQRAWADKNFSSFEQYFTAKAPVVGPLNPLPESGTSHKEKDPIIIAKAARAYQMEQAKLGESISTTEAVNHIIKKGVAQ